MHLPLNSEETQGRRLIPSPIRKPRLARIFIPLFALTVIAYVFLRAALPSHFPPRTPDGFTPSSLTAPEFSIALKGPPTLKFRDNLRPDLQYITSWPSSGWTNDVMTYANLIYLAMITQRIPVLPHFTPSHVQGASISVGEVFDLPRLSLHLAGLPVLDWKDVKAGNSSSVETLDCWSVWEAVSDSGSPRESAAPPDLGLDPSYTKAPSWVRHRPDDASNQNHAEFWSLARLTFPEAVAEVTGHTVPAPQMACFDYLYYTCATRIFEYEHDHSPSWRFVARHMHWEPVLQSLALGYVRQTMEVSPLQPIPPWIAIHVRHGDFEVYCDGRPAKECFAPLPVIARRVQEIKNELRRTRGIIIEHVFMTSDEKDEAWWKDVASFGWLTPDHAEIEAKYGPWYPVLVDAVIQSLAIGFVGTARSTMSLLAARRVVTWHGGVTRKVEWGFPGADDHEPKVEGPIE